MCNEEQKLNNCYVCGSKIEIDYSGCIETYGNEWQDISITCTNNKCCMQLILSADFCYLKDYCGDDIIKLWNSLGKSDDS